MKIQGVTEIVPVERLLSAVPRSAAWQWMRDTYLPAGPVCGGCGQVVTGQRAMRAWEDLRKVYCAHCGVENAPRIGTPISQTSWQPEEYVQLLLLAASGRTVAQIAAALGTSTHRVRDLMDRAECAHCPDETENNPGIQRGTAREGAGLG